MGVPNCTWQGVFPAATTQFDEANFTNFAELLPKEIDGRRAVGFRYDSSLASVTLWGDPTTGYPIRIETVWSGIPRTEVTMTHFEINVDLNEFWTNLVP